MSDRKKITVLGAGSWGTALACSAISAGHEVKIWGRNGAVVDEINSNQSNSRYLKGVGLSSSLKATSNLEESMRGVEIILVVTPAQSISQLAMDMAGKLPKDVELILCAKGIDKTSAKLPAQLLKGLAAGSKISVLSGPSFAIDVARGLPTVVTLANENLDQAKLLAGWLSSPNFRVYASDDVVGVELGGALKNVLALAVGVARGLELGASCEAALIARGFGELQRIGAAFGAKPQTMMGLSGLGDLVLTASSPQSRNFRYGMALGRGENTDNLPLAEGVHSAKIAAKLAQDNQVDAPIIDIIARVLANEISAAKAVRQLMDRPLKVENEN